MNKNMEGAIMLIQNSAINIMFPRVENIKRKYILSEEVLKDKFNEATILPIPDDAPDEIPRVLMTSKGEHSQLNISPNALNFETMYTDEFGVDWNKCLEYINARLEDIFSLTQNLTDNNYSFVGVTTNLIWNEISSEGNKKLFENLFKKEAPRNLDDLVVKYTYVQDEKYYVNITLQSIRPFDEECLSVAGALSSDTLTEHTIGISLDVNDRYSFNNTKDYCSGKEILQTIMQLVTKIINEKLTVLVECGEY